MYREFADAEIAERHVLGSIAPPESLATAILELVADGSLVSTAGRDGDIAARRARDVRRALSQD